MKKLLLSLIAIIIFSLSTQAQTDAIVKYFDQYMEDTSFSVVYISPKMFEIIAKLDIETEDQDVVDVVQGLKGLRILSKDHDGKKYYEEAKKKINTTDYEELMVIRDGDENIVFWVKENSGNADIVEELLMLVGGDEFAMLSFVGNIDLNKISKLSSKAGIKGMEHLEKIEKN